MKDEANIKKDKLSDSTTSSSQPSYTPDPDLELSKKENKSKLNVENDHDSDSTKDSPNVSYTPDPSSSAREINERFLETVRNGDLAKFREMLYDTSLPLNVNYQEEHEGLTALHLIVDRENDPKELNNDEMEILKELLSDIRVDINAKPQIGNLLNIRPFDLALGMVVENYNDKNRGIELLEYFFNSKESPEILLNNIVFASHNINVFKYLLKKIHDKKFFEENGLDILSCLGFSARFDGIIEHDILNCFISRMIKVAGVELALEQCIKSIHNFSHLDMSYGWEFAKAVFIPLAKKELSDKEIIKIFDRLIDENNPQDCPGDMEAAKKYLLDLHILTIPEEDSHHSKLNGEIADE